MCRKKVLAAEVQNVLSKYIYKQTSSYYSHEYEKDPANSSVCMVVFQMSFLIKSILRLHLC